ncbi:MAG: AI-2E family transporter [Bacteroidota bacterium]
MATNPRRMRRYALYDEETWDGEPRPAVTGPVRVDPRQSRRFSFERTLRYLGVALVLGGAAWSVWFFRDLVVLLVIGAVLSYVLGPIVNTGQRIGLPRALAVLLTFVGAGLVVTYVVSRLIPFATQQVGDFGVLLAPERLNAVAVSVERTLQDLVPFENGAVVDGLQRGFATLFQQDQLSATLSSALGVFANLAYAVIIVPLVTFFLMKDGRDLRNSLLQPIPNRYYEITIDLLDKIETNIGYYFRALFLRTVVVTVLTVVLLSIIGLENALILGVFTGLANVIPYFGPIIGFMAASVIGIAQTGDFSLVLWVAIAMGIVQIVDNIIQPIVFSKVAKTHPLIVLCVVLIGAELAGIVGMLVSIPLFVIVRVTVSQVAWSLRNYYIFRTA